MTRGELKSILTSRGVDSSSYSLNGQEKSEAYILEKTIFGWSVYYSERGLKTGQNNFVFESSACQYLLNIISEEFSR